MQLTQLILSAVSAPDSQTQKAAEAQIISQRNANPQAFILQLAQITANQGAIDTVRQAAGTILSRNVFFTHVQLQKPVWSTFDLAFKTKVRNCLLTTLGSSKQNPKRAAGDAISKIASIDVPNGDWSQILSSLAQTANNSDITIKKTAIMTLGFICVQFKQRKVHLNNTQCEEIFTAIYLGLLKDDNKQIKRESLIALSNCIGYMQNMLGDKNIRDVAINNVLSCLGVPELTQSALEVLLEYTKYYYQYLGEIIDQLFKATCELINNDCSVVMALQLWNTLATEYLQRMQNVSTSGFTPENLVLKVSSGLMPVVMTCLVKVEKHYDNNVRDAAYKTLAPLAQCCQGSCFELVSSFVQNTIQSPDWKLRQASVMAFSTIVGCKDKAVQGMFQSAMDVFFGLLKDSEQFVVEATAFAFVRILQAFGLSVLRKPNWKTYIELMSQCLKRSDEVATHICLGMSKLTEVPLGPMNHISNDTFLILNIMSQFLLQSPPPQVNIQQGACMCIVNLLQPSKDINVVAQYVNFIMQKFVQIRGNDPLNVQLKTCLLHILHAGVLALRDQSLGTDFLQSVVTLISNHFQNIQCVDGDGLFLIGACTIAGGDQFISLYKSVQPFIMHALNGKNEHQLYKIALGVVADMARTFGTSFLPQCQSFIRILIADFNGDSDRSLKGPILSTLADLQVAIKGTEGFSRCIADIMQIVSMSLLGASSLCRSNDDPEYLDQLKETLVDICQCLISSVSPEDFDYLTNILVLLKNFAILTCNKSQNPTLEYFVRCLSVVFDLVGCIMSNHTHVQKNNCIAILSDPDFITLYKHLCQCSKDSEANITVKYGRTLFGSMRINIH